MIFDHFICDNARCVYLGGEDSHICLVHFSLAHAAEHAHQLKARKYSARCEREGLIFILLAVDTFGRWHPKSLEVTTALGRQLARNVGLEGGEAMRHLRQRLGIMLVRDSVAMLCTRTPTFAPPEIDGDLDRGQPRLRSEPRGK